MAVIFRCSADPDCPLAATCDDNTKCHLDDEVEEYDNADSHGMWTCSKCGHWSPNSHDYCSPCEYNS